MQALLRLSVHMILIVSGLKTKFSSSSTPLVYRLVLLFALYLLWALFQHSPRYCL
jgi:hypothetical protein